MNVDFEEIAEISYLVQNGARLVFAWGGVIDIDNVGEYLSSKFDA